MNKKLSSLFNMNKMNSIDPMEIEKSLKKLVKKIVPSHLWEKSHRSPISENQIQAIARQIGSWAYQMLRQTSEKIIWNEKYYLQFMECYHDYSLPSYDQLNKIHMEMANIYSKVVIHALQNGLSLKYRDGQDEICQTKNSVFFDMINDEYLNLPHERVEYYLTHRSKIRIDCLQFDPRNKTFLQFIQVYSKSKIYQVPNNITDWKIFEYFQDNGRPLEIFNFSSPMLDIDDIMILPINLQVYMTIEDNHIKLWSSYNNDDSYPKEKFYLSNEFHLISLTDQNSGILLNKLISKENHNKYIRNELLQKLIPKTLFLQSLKAVTLVSIEKCRISIPEKFLEINQELIFNTCPKEVQIKLLRKSRISQGYFFEYSEYDEQERRHGHYKIKSKGNHPYMKGEYCHGEKTGKWDNILKCGIHQIEYYRCGKHHGRQREYMFSGDGGGCSLLKDYNCQNGKIHGTYQKFYMNGQLFEELEYHQGKAEGESRIYHPNGKIMLKFHYREGQAFGQFSHYNASGKRIENYLILEPWSNIFLRKRISRIFNMYDDYRENIWYDLIINMHN